MIRLLLTIVLLGALTKGVSAQQTTLTVTNPSDYQRQEVVEADLQTVSNRLGLTSGETFVITASARSRLTSYRTMASC